jgi:hypothetical protein
MNPMTTKSVFAHTVHPKLRLYHCPGKDCDLILAYAHMSNYDIPSLNYHASEIMEPTEIVCDCGRKVKCGREL